MKNMMNGNENCYEVATNFLAMRPGESFTVQNTPLGEPVPEWCRVYRVALVPTPPLEKAHGVSKNEAVICAEYYSTSVTDRQAAWGWVHLEGSSKELIGRELEAVGAAPGEWFTLILDTRPRYESLLPIN